MSKRFKVAAIFAATALILVSPVFAQERELESNTSKATSGLFTTDVDDSIDVIDYTGVEFDKWAGFVGYYDSDAPLSAGFATRFGPIYLGTWFSGNVIGTDKRRTDTITTDIDEDLRTWNEKVYTTQFDSREISSDNQLQVLIGVAGMGFKVGFYEKMREQKYLNTTFEVTDGQDGKTYFGSNSNYGEIISYSDVEGTLFPSLEWGMKLDLGGISIAPRVFVGFEIGLNRQEQVTRPSFWTNAAGEKIGSEVTDYWGHNKDILKPTFGVGADVGFGDWGIEVGYGISFGVYGSKYDIAGFTGDAPGFVSTTSTNQEQVAKTLATTTTTTNASLDFEDKSSMNHEINLSFYKYAEPFRGLELGFSVGAEIKIGTESIEAYNRTFSKTVTEFNHAAEAFRNTTTTTESFTQNDPLKETTTVTFDPTCAIGARYTMFPNRFSMSAGVSVTPISIENKTIRTRGYSVGSTSSTQTVDADGNVISKSETVSLQGDITDSVEIDNELSSLSMDLGGGFTFSFNERMTLDLGVSGAVRSGNFNLNISNVNVLLSFKF